MAAANVCVSTKYSQILGVGFVKRQGLGSFFKTLRKMRALQIKKKEDGNDVFLFVYDLTA